MEAGAGVRIAAVIAEILFTVAGALLTVELSLTMLNVQGADFV